MQQDEQMPRDVGIHAKAERRKEKFVMHRST